MHRTACLLALALVLLSPAAHADERRTDPGALTLERLFGGGPSFTKGIPRWRWRPGHAELLRTARGRRLETMDPETGKTKLLLDLKALDELVPGKGTRMRGIGRSGVPAFKWRPDGKALCAVVKGDLVWVDLETGARRRLTETKAPMADLNVASDGSHVSFSRENELWVVPTQAGKPRRLTSGSSETLLNATLDWVYPEELGHKTAAWISPDAKHVAYLQLDESQVPRYRVPGLLPLRSQGREMFYPKAGDPNPKVRVGVVPIAGGDTVWMDLGNPAPEYVVRVAWLPDSSHLHVVTLDRAQRHLRIHGCVPDTGMGEVFHEERDDAWIAPPPAPRFVEKGFLWRSQRRWWVSTQDGGTPLTPEGVEAFEILHYDAKTGRALYSGIEHGDVTQGVFEGGPKVKRIRRAKFARSALHWTTAKIDATGTYALVSISTAVEPTKTRLVRVRDGEILRDIGDAWSEKLDEVQLAVPEYGHVKTEGGRINWRLWKPAGFKRSRKYGLLVHVYAGPGSRMVSNKWGRGPMFATLLTQRGFFVLEADGRGTGGQGRDFMKCVQGRLGILELEDQVRAVHEITKRSYVDADRVGIWGWSYGGTMACNALTMRSDVFKAGVAVASVTDWHLYDTIYTERYMGQPKENIEGYRQTASVNHAKKMTGHLLLMHGLGDDNVHAQNTVRLVEAFIKAGNRNYDVMLYPRRGHGIGGASLDVFTRMLRHFERYIGPE